MVSKKALSKSIDAALKSATATETGRTHPFYGFKPFEAMRDGTPHPQKAFFWSESKLQACIAGNRTGKSYSGQQKARCLAIGSDPTRPGYRFPIEADAGHPFVIWYICPPDTVRKQLDDLDRGLPRSVKRKVHYSTGKERIVGEPTKDRPHGWEIHVKSRQKGLEQFQYAVVHAVFFDEEPPEEIWVECQARLVSTSGWTIITLTPVYGSTWLFQKLRSMDKAYENALGGDFGWYSWSIYENPTLPVDAIKRFEDEIASEEEHAIRIKGEYRTLGGDRYFPVDVVAAMRRHILDPSFDLTFGMRGQPIVTSFSHESKGWRLFRDPKAMRHSDVFVIGADPSNGVGQDFSVAHVLDAETGEQVAVFRNNQVEPWDFGVELAYASKFWNDALVFPEMNLAGNAIYRSLKMAGCVRIGRRHAYGGKVEEIEQAFGWLTGRHNKNPGFQELLVSMRETMRGHLGIVVHDEHTLDELDGIWWLREGRPGSYGIGAINKKGHDDHAMALVIALQATYQAPRSNRFQGVKIIKTDADLDMDRYFNQEERRNRPQLTGLAALKRGFRVGP